MFTRVQSPQAGLTETHTAVVFFVGDRAYKLKKPVSLGFLDFSRLATRAAVCRRLRPSGLGLSRSPN
jgi:uncharacterized protein